MNEFRLPKMQRCFTVDEIERHLPHCFDYVAKTFGPDECISVERLRDYRAKGVHFYQPYGDFSQDPPKVLAITNAVLISHAELDLMKRGIRAETELEPWRIEDGKAVLWVASVVSDVMGGAVKCIGGVLDQIEASPFKDEINKLAVFATGPKGIMMAERFGFNQTGNDYRGQGMPFLERDLMPGDIARMGGSLLAAWGESLREEVRSRIRAAAAAPR